LAVLLATAAMLIARQASAQGSTVPEVVSSVPQLPQEDWPYSSQMIGPVAVQTVAPHVYMLTINGLNIGLQTGWEGSVVIDAGPAASGEALVAAIQQLSSTPVRYLIDTSADAEIVGGNPPVAAIGRSLQQNPLCRTTAVNPYVGRYAMVVAPEGLLARMQSEEPSSFPTWAEPTEIFSRPQYDFYLNGEPISIVSEPGAHSKDDTVVRFEHSEVVVAGEIFDATGFPVIDLAHGGSIQGEIDALNSLLNRLTFAPSPMITNTGGTLVIPLRGPVSDNQDVMWYRDMVGDMRDRVADFISQRMTLKQILAADPAQGYKSRYGHSASGYTADRFITDIYQSLMQQRRTAGKGRIQP
jgi:glyoxylase-like metal-dependent hydrolase (beta-lactamase superfamily II)